MNELELYWAAGFFDGEGHAFVRQKDKKSGVSFGLTIGQINREPLDRFQHAVGGGKVYGPYQTKGEPIFLWQVEKYSEATRIAKLLFPALSIIKATQILDCLDRITRYRDTIKRGRPKKDVPV